MPDGPQGRVARPLAAAISITVAAAIAGACGRDPTSPDICPESTVLNVSPGLEPTFSWSGGCSGNVLYVQQLTPPNHNVWYIGSPSDKNRFESPVQYGRVPPGGVSQADALEPLVAGRRYAVAVVSSGGGSSSFIRAEFVP